MKRATKVRIYPTGEQQAFLDGQFGAVRFVWNKALFIKKHAFSTHGLSFSCIHDLKPLIARAKKNNRYQWLKTYDAVALQQSVRNLDKAFQRFFDPGLPTRFPRFKHKKERQSSYHCTGVSVGDQWIKIPKCRPIKAHIHRKMQGKLKSITLSRTASGKYYASLLYDDDLVMPAKPKKIERIEGIDVGISSFLVRSDGQKVANPRFLQRALKKLRTKQKKLSRTKKNSKGRAKARLLVAKAHERVAFAREDFHHKLSKQLVDENQAIVIEGLKVKNMLQNRKLARHIADVGWRQFFTFLNYKCKQQGAYLIETDQWLPSSKTCSGCGAINDELCLEDRQWRCKACETMHDRDLNAAINLRKEGIRILQAEGLSVSADGGKRKSGVAPVAA